MSTQNQSHLSQVLRSFAEARGLSIRQVARLFDQHNSHLTKVFNGLDRLSQASLVRMLTVLRENPEATGLSGGTAKALSQSLLVAWLKDWVPEGWTDEVEIAVRASAAEAGDESNAWDPLTIAIRRLHQMGQEHPHVADWLIASEAIVNSPEEIDSRLASAAAWRQKNQPAGSIPPEAKPDDAPDPPPAEAP